MSMEYKKAQVLMRRLGPAARQVVVDRLERNQRRERRRCCVYQGPGVVDKI